MVTMASDDKLRLYNTQKAAPSLQPVAQVTFLGLWSDYLFYISDDIFTLGET